MLGYYLGAKLGASIKEKFRAKYYDSFVDLLRKSRHVREPLEQSFIASLPVTIYNSAFSTPKTYIVVLTNGIYLDLKPSTKDDTSRIAVLNRRTILNLELIEPGLLEKMSILSLGKYVRVTLADADGSGFDKYLFCDLPGERTLTMDRAQTRQMFEYLREIKLNSQIKRPAQ